MPRVEKRSRTRATASSKASFGSSHCSYPWRMDSRYDGEGSSKVTVAVAHHVGDRAQFGSFNLNREQLTPVQGRVSLVTVELLEVSLTDLPERPVSTRPSLLLDVGDALEGELPVGERGRSHRNRIRAAPRHPGVVQVRSIGEVEVHSHAYVIVEIGRI